MKVMRGARISHEPNLRRTCVVGKHLDRNSCSLTKVWLQATPGRDGGDTSAMPGCRQPGCKTH